MKALTIKAMLTFEECEARQKAIEAKTWKEDVLTLSQNMSTHIFLGVWKHLSLKVMVSFIKKVVRN